MWLGCEGVQLGRGDGVVAEHLELGAQLAQVLHQVIGKRIVVVDDGDHAAPPSELDWNGGQAYSGRFSAISTAWARARALFSDSWYSVSGSESATIPHAGLHVDWCRPA